MITGRGRTLKKYTVEEDLQNKRPSYVSEFNHKMLWGKTLRDLVKEAVNMVRKAQTDFGADAQIYTVVYWNGNELVGPGGVADETRYPFPEIRSTAQVAQAIRTSQF